MFDLDEALQDHIENHTGNFSHVDTCGKCQDGLYEHTDYVPYGSTSVSMTSYEVCDCVYDSQKLQIKVFVKWLKQEILDNEFSVQM